MAPPGKGGERRAFLFSGKGTSPSLRSRSRALGCGLEGSFERDGLLRAVRRIGMTPLLDAAMDRVFLLSFGRERCGGAVVRGAFRLGAPGGNIGEEGTVGCCF